MKAHLDAAVAGSVTHGCRMQDAAADQKFVLSTLRDVALLTCRSRAAELARQTEEEERAFAAAVVGAVTNGCFAPLPSADVNLRAVIETLRTAA